MLGFQPTVLSRLGVKEEKSRIRRTSFSAVAQRSSHLLRQRPKALSESTEILRRSRRELRATQPPTIPTTCNIVCNHGPGALTFKFSYLHAHPHTQTLHCEVVQERIHDYLHPADVIFVGPCRKRHVWLLWGLTLAPLSTANDIPAQADITQ